MNMGNKNHVGKTLKNIRTSKGLTIDRVSNGILSKSQLSRFERGESEISFSKLNLILDNLNVSIEELMSIHNNDTGNSFNTILVKARKSFVKNDIAGLENLLSNTNDNFTNTMIKSLIFALDKSYQIPILEIDNLIDYLFKVDKWGAYELSLFGNCVRIFEYSTFFLLTKEMIINQYNASKNQNHKKLVTQLAINCLITSIENEEFSHSDYLTEHIENLLENELNFYEKTVFLYVKGYHAFMLSNEFGRESMENALGIFELLNETDLYNNYRKHYLDKVKSRL